MSTDKKAKKEKIPLGESMKIIGKALRVSIKVKGPLSLAVDVIGFAAAFLPLLIAQTLKTLTNQVQALFGKGEAGLSAALYTMALLAAFYIAQTVYSFLRERCRRQDRIRTTRHIRRTVMDTAVEIKYKYIENYDNFNEKIMFASQYSGGEVAASMQSIIVILQSTLSFVSLSLALMRVNALIVLILLATCTPAVVLSFLQKDSEYREKTKWMQEGAMVVCCLFMAVGEYHSRLIINEVRFYNVYEHVKRIWRKNIDIYIKKKTRMTQKHVLFNSMADLLRNVVYIAILLITAKEIFDNPALGLGTFALVFSVTSQLQDVISRIFVGTASFLGNMNYMRDFFGLEQLEREAVDENAPMYDRMEIEFCNVDFSYPNSDAQILKNINLRIKPGEKIAIVGENGSGKSTFISLLCGMHEPTGGKILVNGGELSEQLSSVRGSMSVVFQDFGKYETSIRENITLSDQDRHATDEEIYELLRRTNAIDVVEEQPDKLDEKLGLFSEKSRNLSGGQWQKIAIVRTAYHDKASVMVLDEPTAALDPKAEAQLYRDFEKLTGDRTVILISHRLGITSVVDRVLVFDDGKIVEDGSHAELIHKGGKYTEMYNAQAQWYE